VWEIAQLRRLWLSGAVLAVGLVFGWPTGGFAAATRWVGDNHAAARLITATTVGCRPVTSSKGIWLVQKHLKPN
jgi:hypothetical protein